MMGATGDVTDGATVYEVAQVDGLTSVVISAGVVGTGATVDCSALDQSPQTCELDGTGTGTMGVVDAA